MNKVLFVLLVFLPICAFSQNIQYSFKIEHVNTSAQAKGVFDVVRHYFNSAENPYEHKLTFSAESVFQITVPFDKSEQEILGFFQEKNLTIVDLRKVYIE